MSSLEIFIDKKSIQSQEGKSVLNAALEAGIYVPHLCSHPDLTPQGGCKLCVVEIEGEDGPVTACTTIVREGMRIKTDSAQLLSLRRASIEFMLAGHPHDCTSCRSYLNCELQALMQYLSVAHSRMREIHKTTTRLNTNNPLISRDMERCIQCGRCVRACHELRGVGIIDYRKKNDETYIGTQGDISLAQADCRFCSACVEVCPTGALRDEEGVFREDIPLKEALIPCSAQCPAHVDIPAYLRFIRQGKYSEAVSVIREKVPFALTLGYICSRFCEKGCKRTKLNDAVSICELKRFAVEHDMKELWRRNSFQKPQTGKKLAIIGSGPAGLTAAYYLAKCGHEVTVFERMPVAGGIPATAIPSYRLPKDILKKEIEIIQQAGVTIKTGIDVSSVFELKEQGYDAILVAVGAAAGGKLSLPGSDLTGNLSALAFLQMVGLNREIPQVAAGKKVVVLGGGSVAFDAARVARRFGASVSVVCLEKRDGIPADHEELEQALEENIHILAGKSSLAIEGNEGRVTGIRIIDVSSFRFIEGCLEVKIIEGTEQLIECDTIIFATGQRPDISVGFGLELNRFGYPVCDRKTFSTPVDRIYLAGDIVTGTKSVIDAINGGRKAAQEIDRYLGGDGDINETLVERLPAETDIGRQVGFAHIKRQNPGLLPGDERTCTFGCVDGGLSAEQADIEANRCLQCDLRTQITKNRMWNSYTSR